MTQIEKSELTKNKILAAAEGEFSEKGIWGARIDAIAESAGVNKRMIYEHYGNKENLYKTVLEIEIAVIKFFAKSHFEQLTCLSFVSNNHRKITFIEEFREWNITYCKNFSLCFFKFHVFLQRAYTVTLATVFAVIVLSC